MNEIYKKVENNINDSIKEIRMERIKQHKNDQLTADSINKMKQDLERAKQNYLVNKDSMSLSKYA